MRHGNFIPAGFNRIVGSSGDHRLLKRRCLPPAAVVTQLGFPRPADNLNQKTGTDSYLDCERMTTPGRNFFFNNSGDFAVKKTLLAGNRLVAPIQAASAVLVGGKCAL
jgi:hypothetical protein